MPAAKRNLLGLSVLLVAGAALGTIAVRAKERSYVVPTRPAPSAVPHALSGEVPPGCTVRRFDVEGMCCQGCAAKLHGALLALEGVREAALDSLAGTVEVVATAELADERLLAALTFDKYRAAKKEANRGDAEGAEARGGGN
jgi:copper chaperone CopZ